MRVNSPPVVSRATAAAEVLFDDHQLARRARTTLAGADTGMLLTADHRGRATLTVPVRVFDDGGGALIPCDRDSALAGAAHAQRLASLMLAPNPTFGVRLTLSGRLTPINVGTDADADADADRTATRDMLVALRVEQIQAGCPHGQLGLRRAEQRQVPIAIYALAEPDALAANIPRLIAHLNSEHPEQVRWLAVYATGLPLARLVGATLTALTADQAVLCWVDESGAHPAILPFAQPAQGLSDLAATLRGCAEAARESGR
jgi:hypothetical protein